MNPLLQQLLARLLGQQQQPIMPKLPPVPPNPPPMPRPFQTGDQVLRPESTVGSVGDAGGTTIPLNASTGFLGPVGARQAADQTAASGDGHALLQQLLTNPR